MHANRSARPWYRQLWPWLVMLPPAAAVVGGFTTLYLAISRPDREVCGDYVRDGFGTYPKAAEGGQARTAGCD
jgi:uncharacterized protein